jgi:DNA-binding transcriptional regulator YdaS (Cro superfamily)
MHLATYLKETGRSQAEFGSTLLPPVSQGQMSQWILGRTRVTLDYALQIETGTEGKVTPKDCAEMYSDL